MARKISLGTGVRAVHAIILTTADLNEWAGRTLSEDEIERLAECVQHSSIPQAVATIVDSFGIVEDDDLPEVPDNFPVRPIDGRACKICGRVWDDAIPTAYTPTPSGRCPFEAFH
jgi:hypothetical protein